MKVTEDLGESIGVEVVAERGLPWGLLRWRGQDGVWRSCRASQVEQRLYDALRAVVMTSDGGRGVVLEEVEAALTRLREAQEKSEWPTDLQNAALRSYDEALAAVRALGRGDVVTAPAGLEVLP